MRKHSLTAPMPAPPRRCKVPLSTPLRHVRFRQLWIANLISNLGTWTQTFASAWLIATVSDSASMSSLVQTATYIPIFLFALFAGVIADAVNRPKFLFICNLFMALCACAMALLVMQERATPGALLALTFCLGCGSAFMWPAWQASMSGLVEPDEVEAAATLNNLSYNAAAIVGPALGGVLFAWVGPGALFLLNAASFIGLLGVYWFWWREHAADAAPAGFDFDFAARLKAGLATALGCARYRHILLNVGTVFFATIAFAALLPVFVKDILRMESNVFGLLMGSLGAGAVGGAFLLPTLRQHVAKTPLLAAALLVYGSMLLALPFLRSLAILVPLIVAAGMAWSATVSTLNAAAQLAFPAAIRARTLSVYLFVMAAGYTSGSLVWGRVADRFGVQAALAVAGACVVINAIALLAAKRETPI
jgi:predicted MFS family arabinose efflux permease